MARTVAHQSVSPAGWNIGFIGPSFSFEQPGPFNSAVMVPVSGSFLPVTSPVGPLPSNDFRIR